MLEQAPSSGRVAPLPPTNPHTKHVICLIAPLSFSVRLAAEISGMTSASGQGPGVVSWVLLRHGRQKRVGAAPRSRSVSADLTGLGISCISGSLLPLAVDWKCQVGV